MKKNRGQIGSKLIDVHTHCGGIDFTHYFMEIFPYCCTIKELLMNMDKAKIDYSVTFPVPTNVCTLGLPKMVQDISRVIFAYEPCPYYWANRRLLMEVQMEGRDRILPFVILSLYGEYTEQIKNIKLLMQEYDVYGIKIHPSADQTGLKKIIEDEELRSFINDSHLPIIVHSGNEHHSEAISMVDVFESLPETRFCVAHAGRMNSRFISQLNRYDNVWIDVSPIYKLPEILAKTTNSNIIQLDYDNPLSIIRYLWKYYPNKIIFGTDYPWVACGSLEKYKASHLDDYYLKSIELLKQIPLEMMTAIANSNTCDFIFGKD